MPNLDMEPGTTIKLRYMQIHTICLRAVNVVKGQVIGIDERGDVQVVHNSSVLKWWPMDPEGDEESYEEYKVLPLPQGGHAIEAGGGIKEEVGTLGPSGPRVWPRAYKRASDREYLRGCTLIP